MSLSAVAAGAGGGRGLLTALCVCAAGLALTREGEKIGEVTTGRWRAGGSWLVLADCSGPGGSCWEVGGAWEAVLLEEAADCWLAEVARMMEVAEH